MSTRFCRWGMAASGWVFATVASASEPVLVEVDASEHVVTDEVPVANRQNAGGGQRGKGGGGGGSKGDGGGGTAWSSKAGGSGSKGRSRGKAGRKGKK